MSGILRRSGLAWWLVAWVFSVPFGWAEEPTLQHSLGLELELVDLSAEQEFRLFRELGGAADGDMFRLGQLASASANPPPGLDPPIPLTLTPVLTFDLADPGKTDLRLFKLDRKSWDELDTWEKIGLVTSYASAVAGMVGLALEAVD
jgi:hypothetical protein